jgi:hypothetical protein
LETIIGIVCLGRAGVVGLQCDILSGRQLTTKNVHATTLDVTRCPSHTKIVKSKTSN